MNIAFDATRRKSLARALGLALGGLMGLSAHAQIATSGKPVRLVVGFAAGGFTDTLARAIAQRLQGRIGVPVIVENKPGATGTIAADMVARSPADGLTLLMGHFGSNAVAPALFPRLPYDVFRDFTPIIRVASTPMLLVVHPSVPATDLKSFIEHVRRNPDRLGFASSGNGTAQHLAAAQFMHATQTQMVHVPYKGSGPAMADLLGGQVQLNFESPPNALPHVRAGKLNVLGITSLKRSPLLPQVPTLNEAGVPGFEMNQWFGVFGPRGMAAPLVAQLNAEIGAILKQPEVIEQISSQGGEVIGGSAADFADFLRKDVPRWAALVKAAGIRLD